MIRKPLNSFVSFYKSNNIIPVRRNILSKESFSLKRSLLLTSLGVCPALVAGSSVLEFGPGTGHYSTHLASFAPKIFHLVDANPKSLDSLERALNEMDFGKKVEYKIFDSLFLDFESSITYNLVVAEGCIPHQESPAEVIRHMSKYVANGGVLLFTTIDAISYLSETLRRLVYDVIFVGQPRGTLPIEECLPQLLERLSPHLEHMRSMTRRYDDWIIDNIIQPLEYTSLFSISDAINTLNDNFVFMASSPAFFVNYQWYKDVSSYTERNAQAINAYYESCLNLIDYRSVFPRTDRDFGVELARRCDKTWEAMKLFSSSDQPKVDNVLKEIYLVSNLLEGEAPETVSAIREALDWISDGAPALSSLKYFPAWWGRGQQHVSLSKFF